MNTGAQPSEIAQGVARLFLFIFLYRQVRNNPGGGGDFANKSSLSQGGALNFEKTGPNNLNKSH